MASSDVINQRQLQLFTPGDPTPHVYSILHVLGEGNYGKVYKAQDVVSGEVVAIKQVLPDSNNPEECNEDGIPQSALREAELLSDLKHPNIVRLLGVYWDNQNTMYMVLEYLRRSLRAHIYMQKTTPFPKLYVKHWMHQLLSGMVFTHGQNVMHRDLKPDNLLLTTRGHLRIADFGLARDFEDLTRPATYTPEVSLSMQKHSGWVRDLTREGIEKNPGWICKTCSRQIKSHSVIAEDLRIPRGEMDCTKLTHCPWCSAERTKHSIRYSAVRRGEEEHMTPNERMQLHRVHVLQATGRTIEQAHSESMMSLVKQLRIGVADENGKCAIGHGVLEGCTGEPTDIDHLDANTILQTGDETQQGIVDGLRRKGVTFSQVQSTRELLSELARNTDRTGRIILQGVCRLCHERKTRIKSTPCVHAMSSNLESRRNFVNAYKRQIGKCQDPACRTPKMLCTMGTELLFHMDHLHPVNCAIVSSGCRVGTPAAGATRSCVDHPELRKSACIGALVLSGPMEALQRELRPEIVRMIHSSCHLQHTIAQSRSGLLQTFRAPVREAAMASEEMRPGAKRPRPYKPTARSGTATRDAQLAIAAALEAHRRAIHTAVSTPVQRAQNFLEPTSPSSPEKSGGPTDATASTTLAIVQ